MRFLDNMFDRLAQFIIARFFSVRLSVKWGNRHWYEYQEFLFPYGDVKKNAVGWTDYSTLPGGDTAHLLEGQDESAKLRRRYNAQILDVLFTAAETPEKRAPICILTSGGTASGKTSAIDEFAKEFTSLRIDFDRIKKLLPEYVELVGLKHRKASEYVQSESIKIGGKLFKKAIKEKADVIYEKTLDNPVRTISDIKDLRKKGYAIYIVATHLTLEEGLKRAEERFFRSGRHVPDNVIRRIYTGVPSSLFEIKDKVDGIYLFDNNGERLELMFQRIGPDALVINRNLYDRYLSYVGANLDISK